MNTKAQVILRSISVTILFFAIYTATLFQESYFGEAVISIGTDTLLTIYILLLSYILFELSKFTVPFKEFLLSLAIYLIIEVITLNISVIYPLPFTFFQSNSFNILMFLLSFALARIDIPIEKYEKIQPIVTSIGLILTGYFGYVIITSLPVDIAGEIAIIFLLFLMVLAISVLASISESEIGTWLLKSRRFLLLFIIVFSIYYIFIKPMLIDRPGISNLIEWFAVILLFIKLARDIKKTIKVDESDMIEIHKQRVSIRKDEWVEEFKRAQDNFVNDGIRSHLVAALSKPLFDMGWSEEKVAYLISPIISHRDKEPPTLSLNWEKRVIMNRNRNARKKVVEKLIEKMREVGVKIEI